MSATQEDAIRIWKQLMEGKENAEILRFGLTGDGSDSTTADVDGRQGWAWVRYDEEPNKVSQVRNRIFPGIQQDIPVVIGKKFVTDKEVQILGINWPLYDMSVNQDQLQSYLVAPHGPTHHAVLGTDPAEIDVRNILNLRIRPNDPATMGVFVESGPYPYQDTRAWFGGGGIDLTNEVPGTTNYQRYIIVSLDTVEQRLRIIPGPESPNTVPATPPRFPIWNIPIGAVLLYFGQTTILEADVYDYRFLFNPVGMYQTYRNLIQWIDHQELIWTQHLRGEI